ncbi:MAG: hypothetical protein SFX73_29235 [Kofleriaceae bacterium]|nr:hypothetical protein [Kofleriaceae bacterium]
MSSNSQILRLALLATLGACANASSSSSTDGGQQGSGDASCGEICDADADGVLDNLDKCPSTPSGSLINMDGCAESQLPWMLVPFPPFGLQWTPSGDLGRAGGLTWTYTGIQREDLFRIVWMFCDDPATPCGLSLDGPIDALETWHYSMSDSNLTNGRLAFTNSTHIVLDGGGNPTLAGRLTMNIVDSSEQPLTWAPVATLGVSSQDGKHGAEITGVAFKITALAEIQDPMTLAWTPYLDYYDAAQTPMAGTGATVSFGGSFYAK